MALTPCKSCKQQVDSSAKTCPHCGVADPGVTAGQKFMGLIVLGLIIAVVVTMCSGNSDDTSTTEVPKVDPAVCRQDLACWAEAKFASASAYCKDPVERLANFNARWTDGTFETKFSRYRWKDKELGLVTYIGDKVEFQNGFGAYQNHIYECDFDPVKDAVLDVRAQPGRF
jgi:hypothetical protein